MAVKSVKPTSKTLLETSGTTVAEKDEPNSASGTEVEVISETSESVEEGGQEQTIWELLDELLPVSGTTLAFWMTICMVCLSAMCSYMMYLTYGKLEFYLYGGFVALMLSLFCIVVWVLCEARGLEAAKQTDKKDN